ncbi:MAG: hypothetical protein Q4Q62_06455 [Thermoplasmata archaeon]|nr:hypothetical protein [Thermoplasmata archaeon]
MPLASMADSLSSKILLVDESVHGIHLDAVVRDNVKSLFPASVDCVVDTGE